MTTHSPSRKSPSPTDHLVADQRNRLLYLRTQYPVGMLSSDTVLYAKLKLLGSSQGTLADSLGSAKPIDPGLARSLPSMTIDTFKKRMSPRSSYSDKASQQPFGKNLCDGLGWVIAAECEYWSREQKQDQAFFDQKRAQISDYIARGSPQPAEILGGLRWSWAEEITNFSLNRKAGRDTCRKFLAGDILPVFSFVSSGATIARGQVESAILEAIADQDKPILLVTSAAGDGKTTLLMRLAQQCRRDGAKVYLATDRQFNNHAFQFQLGYSDHERSVLLIDNAQTIPDMARLAEWSAANPGVTVVLAARATDWLKGEHSTHVVITEEFFLDRISEQEAEDLALTFLDFGVVDKGTSKESLTDAFLSVVEGKEYPHFLAAVMSVAKGKNFRDIICSMAENFPQRAILATTAICSVIDDGDGKGLSTKVLHAACHKDGGDAGKLSEGIEWFDRTHKGIRSEILLKFGARYDLRHPDIARIVMEHLYQANEDGEFLDTTNLEDDVWRIISAIQNVRISKRPAWTRNLPRISRLVGALLASSSITDKAPIVNQLEMIRASYGNESSERVFYAETAFSVYLHSREALQDNAEALGAFQSIFCSIRADLAEPIASGNLPAPLLKRACATLTNVVSAAITLELEAGDDSRSNSERAAAAKDTFLELWNFESGILQKTGVFTSVATKLAGAFPDEEEGRRFLADLLRGLDEAGKLDAGWIGAWFVSVPQRLQLPIGDAVDPQPFTYRWLLRMGIEEANFENSYLVGLHVQLEKRADDGHIGPPITGEDSFEDHDRFSARWVLREVLNRDLDWDSYFVSAYVILERDTKDGFIGNYKDDDGNFCEPQKYSARWLLREAVYARGLWDSYTVTQYANFERDQADGFIGSLQTSDGTFCIPQVGSARHVLFAALSEHDMWDGNVVECYLYLERVADGGFVGSRLNRFGNEIPLEAWSARWVGEQAILEHGINDSKTISSFVNLELSQPDSNIGTFADNDDRICRPDPRSVRGVLLNALLRNDFSDPQFLEIYSDLERHLDDDHIGAYLDGSYTNAEEYSVRWCVRKAIVRDAIDCSKTVGILIKLSGFDPVEDWGDPKNPPDGSINSLLRTVWKKHDSLPQYAVRDIYSCTDRLLMHSIGEFDDPAFGTLGFYFRAMFSTLPNDVSILRFLLRLERMREPPEFGAKDCSTQWTIRWLASRILDLGMNAKIAASWFMLERENGADDICQAIEARVRHEISQADWQNAVESASEDLSVPVGDGDRL